MAEKDNKKEKDFLEKARKRLKWCIDADNHNRLAAVEDLRFIKGGDDMWDAREVKQRNNDRRPHLSINLLNKFRNQLVGEQRQNRVRIKVRPASSEADVNTAKIYEGLVCSIEYQSKHKVVYNTAYDSTVECGYGAWEILARKVKGNPFIQEIYLRLIENPMTVYLDPDNPEDPMYGFIITKMNRDVFKDEYPKATEPDDNLNKGQGIAMEHWWDKDTVTVARYYERTTVKKTLCLMNNGDILPEEEAKKRIAAWQKTVNALKKQGQEAPQAAVPSILKTDEDESYEMKCYTITALDILDEKDCPGTMVPVVLMLGRQRNIEGKRYVWGFIRDAKDPQKLFNYWNTSGAEHIALAPKSPWLATNKMIGPYKEDYLSANTRNLPVLLYEPDERVPGMRPERMPAPQPPVAIFTALAEAKQNISDALGMYNRDIGDKGPEVSGAAIRQAQLPGDVGTYDIFDNYKLAIEQTGRIIVDMIPKVYDTARDVEIRNEDDSTQLVPVNTTAGQAYQKMQDDPGKYRGINLEQLNQQMKLKGQDAQYNPLKKGRYGIVVDTSPSTSTQRQEAAEKFMGLLATPMGQLIERIAPDLVIKNFDFLESDEFARRARKILPQGLIEPKPGDPPSKPLPPPPPMLVQMLKAQTETAKQRVQQVALQVKLAELYKQTKESETEIRTEILRILSELHSPQHPADAMVAGNGGQ